MYNEDKNTQTSLFGDEVKAIEQEVTICVEREYDRTKDDCEQHYIRAIKNRHEGYGHASQLAADAIAMAATAKRIIYDIMVEAGNEEYPIEALINSTDDDENTETDNADDIEYADADAQ